MHHKLAFWIIVSLLTLGLVLAVSELPSSLNTLSAQMMGDRNMQRDMQMIHQLSANHDQIRRSVKQTPNGIQAVTESDNPQVATLLQKHVSSMYKRLETGQAFPMIQMVPTLPTLFRNADRYQRQLKITPKGVMVNEATNNPELVAVIREHAHEIDGFVKAGMSNMMDGMMR